MPRLPSHYYRLQYGNEIIAAAFCRYRRKVRLGDSQEGDRQIIIQGDGTDSGSSVVYTKWDVELSTDGFLHLHSQPQLEDS